ncbi:30S ribosomal protein S16 [Candidatus Poriferisocius sp.]|uniref:30S ribosomal protein S16 n=1 Tax=Candidatus Poriferisocius sp. TaxID=3101276 RepID=UPI003B01380F
MAVRLRLMRMGKKKQPTYRVVAADSRKARNGRFIEIVGTYNPRQDPSLIQVDNERALYWLRHGAQPSERVQKLLVISGAWEEFTGKAEGSGGQPEKVTVAASAEGSGGQPEKVTVAASAEGSGGQPEKVTVAASAEMGPDEAGEGSEQDVEKVEDDKS